MSDAAFNFNDLSIRMGMNQGKSGSGGDEAENVFQFLFDSVGGLFTNATKLAGIPNMEGLPSQGTFKQYDSQGIQDKMVNPFAQSFAATGGFLYKMFSALIKNSEITDHAHGIEAVQHVASGDYGSGGGDSGGGGESSYGHASISDLAGTPMSMGESHIEPLTMNYGGRTYEVASMSSEVLGNITPSAGASISDIRGKDEMGLG